MLLKAYKIIKSFNSCCLQCFDAVGWASRRALIRVLILLLVQFHKVSMVTFIQPVANLISSDILVSQLI